MTTSRELVDGYLADLERSAASLPPDRARELVADVREHIAEALAAAGSRDDATVRNALDRLGSPADIVAADSGSSEGSRQLPMPLPDADPIDRGGTMLVTRIVLASITIAGALLVVVMAVVLGPAAALSSLAIAVLTPYVWVPLLISLVAFGLHRELRGPTRPGREGPGAGVVSLAAGRRVSSNLVGLGMLAGILVLLLAWQGPFSMGVAAVLFVPIVVLLLVLEVLRGRRGRV